MGVLLGLLLGIGLLLVLQSFSPPRPPAPRRRGRLTVLLEAAGHPSLTPTRVIASCAGLGLTVALLVLAISETLTIALVVGGLSSYVPVAVLSAQAVRRRRALRVLWPEVVDDLASAVRAGMSLSEALAALGERGPAQLRPAFARFAADHRTSGRFGDSLDRLKADLADPVADRVVEALRLAREVGGTDLGRLLRTLSTFLREEARLRGDLETRQGWTVNAARLAVAAPWVTLLFLSLRPEAVAAYRSATGLVVLLTAAGVSVLAYRLMVRLGRLPEDERVLA